MVSRVYCIKSTDNTQLFGDRSKGAKHVDKANPQINTRHKADDIKYVKAPLTGEHQTLLCSADPAQP